MKLTSTHTEAAQEKRRGFSFSLGIKIVLPVVGVITIACVLLFTLYSKRIEDQSNLFLKNQLDSFATSKAEELTEPLWSFQTDLLARLMHSYRDNPNLFKISLYDANGQLIVEETDCCELPFSTLMTTERTLTRMSGDEVFTLGKLVVQYHDGYILSDLSSRWQSDIAFTIALMVILAGTVWLTIHLLVGRPLQRIKSSLNQNRTNNQRNPLVWESRDELGDVVRAYNNLLVEVEQQTSTLLTMNQSLRSEVDNRRMAELELAKIHEELEQKVAIRTLELKQANYELKELDQQRAAFLSSASHELRTPLAAVLGFTSLIRKNFNKFFMPVVDEHALRDKGELIINNLDIISKEGDRLTRLIDDLLDLNKIESGHMDWRDQELDVAEELNRCANTMKSAVTINPDLELTVTTHPELPALMCDPDRFQQVFINLVSNAIKHTEYGTISLKAKAEDDMIRIQVADTGIGIAENDMPFIFHKFYQSGSNTNFKPAGTGLGLPICKNIVEHYGGEIWVESEVGKGSTFTIELPADISVPKVY